MRISRQKLRRMILESMSLSEHRIAPAPTNIPPHHLHKIHDLIDRGDIEQAQSLIDAFGGPVDYVDNYILYSEVGDMEKLGNRAYDARSTYDRDSLELTSALKDIDKEAIGIADKRGRKLDGDDHSYLFPGSFQTDVQRYLANRDRPLSEHRIAPSPLDLLGLPQSHIDKIHDLINTGDFNQAQTFIDAFGGDPNWVENYRAYEEVGDLEKLGNARADILDNADYSDEEWYESDDYRQLQDLDDQAYRLGADKVSRGLAPGFDGTTKPGARTHASYPYMRDRYMRGMGSVKPLNEHNSSRAGLRRMILQEMSSMGIGGQPPMALNAMMQELQNIEAQLEEMEMQREEWIANEARYGGDEVEAAYAYEEEYPDYYDDKEELQSRAYELEEMIEAAGGPSL